MVFLEVSSAVNPPGANGDEIHIVRHNLRHFVAVVIIERRAESLWQLAGGLLVWVRVVANS
jgi:hypothetical protein